VNRKFILNLLLAIGVNLLIKPFWILGVERSVQNTVGSEAYGLYFALFNFSFLFNIILDFGINNYNSTFISRYPFLLAKKFPQLVILKAALAFVYIIITILAGLAAGYNSLQIKLLLILCLNQILSFAITYIRSNISGMHFFATDSLLSVLDRLLMIIFCSALLWGNIMGPMKITWFVEAQTLSYIITLSICIFILKPYIGDIKWRWNKAFIIHLLRKSYPFAILGVLMGFYMKSDGVLIERLMADGNREAGRYASAYRLFDAGNMIAVLFAGLLLPIFSRMLHQKKDPSFLLKIGFTLIIIPALFAASVCLYYADDLIQLLYHKRDHEVAGVLGWLILSFVFTCMVYIYGTFITAASSLRFLNIIAALACVLNIALNIIMIKAYGITGAAITAFITQGFVALVHFYYTHWKFRIRPDYFLLSKIALVFLAEIFIPFALADLRYGFFTKIFLQGVLTLFLVFALRLADTKQIGRVFQR
jgi:O-antigen/teichoic acid export membrane protein